MPTASNGATALLHHVLGHYLVLLGGLFDFSALVDSLDEFVLGIWNRRMGAGSKSELLEKGAGINPCRLAAGLRTPAMLFAGALDRTVHPDQSIALHDELRAKGVEAHLRILSGEKHDLELRSNIVTVFGEAADFFLERLTGDVADLRARVAQDSSGASGSGGCLASKRNLYDVLSLADVNAARSADLQRGTEAYIRGNYAAALREWRPLAEQGNVGASAALGTMYYGGKGISRDHVEAAKWFRRAAEQGSAPAQRNLALMYRKGEGVSQDHEEAAKWFRRAAEQGSATAQIFLGRAYFKGEGVSQDHEEAAEWFRRVAEQGSAAAQYVLGQMYRGGQGVPQDRVHAHMWTSIAAENGYEKATATRDAVAETMTPSQIDEARRLARECIARDYKGC